MFRPHSIEKDQDEHYEELIERFSCICVEFDDVDDCYTRLKQTLSRSPIEKRMFLSILQHLLCINNERFSRPVYYELIENSISEIVLRENGHDPWSVIRMRIAKEKKNVGFNLKSVSKQSPEVGVSKKEDWSIPKVSKVKFEIPEAEPVSDSSSSVSESSCVSDQYDRESVIKQLSKVRVSNDEEGTVLKVSEIELHPMDEVIPEYPVTESSSSFPNQDETQSPSTSSPVNKPDPSLKLILRQYDQETLILRLKETEFPDYQIRDSNNEEGTIVKVPEIKLQILNKEPLTESSSAPNKDETESPSIPSPSNTPDPSPKPFQTSGGIPPPAPIPPFLTSSGISPPPHPLPLATSGGMPPAPPPAPIATSGGMPPPPPPPPGQSISTAGIKLPYRKDWPKSKTKRIPWTKIDPYKVKENSLWAQITEDALLTNNLLKEIGKTFKTKADEKKLVSEKPQTKISKILDAKNERSLLIVLAKHARNQTYDSVKKSISNCDPEVLSEFFLKSLIGILESIENLASLHEEYVEKYDNYTKADQFCITISTIDRVVERLKCLLFSQRYTQIREECNKAMEDAINACQVVKSSKKFSKLLEYILMIGNIMNSGSYNAKAVGFDISYLTKVVLFMPIFIKNIQR